MCAIIGIANDKIICKSKHNNLLCGGSQVNDNMFRPLFILTRLSLGQT